MYICVSCDTSSCTCTELYCNTTRRCMHFNLRFIDMSGQPVDLFLWGFFHVYVSLLTR